MKITKVECIKRKSIKAKRIYSFVKVYTDEGIYGVGPGGWGPYAIPSNTAGDQICDALSQQISGENPFNIEKISRMTRSPSIELALWDIVGKSSNQPVYNLLGGKVRDCIPMYQHPPDYMHTPTPKELAEDCLKKIREGYKAIKFSPFSVSAEWCLENKKKLGSSLGASFGFLRNTTQYVGGYSYGGLSLSDHPSLLQKGVEYVKILRDVIGDAGGIAIDSHGYWNVPSVIKLMKAVEPYDLLWFEDPIDMWDFHQADILLEVKRQVKTPICTGEGLDVTGFRMLLELHALDILHIDIHRCGGLSRSKNVASMAESYFKPCVLHYGDPLTIIINAHLAVNMPNIILVEVFDHSILGGEVLSPPLSSFVENGCLKVPTRQGWGVDVGE